VIDERVKRVMAGVLGVPLEQISDLSTPETIESWDSFGHISLVMALEEEFSIAFSDQEIAQLGSVQAIVLAVKSRIS